MNLDLILKLFKDGIENFRQSKYYDAVDCWNKVVAETINDDFGNLLAFNAIVNQSAALAAQAVKLLEDAAIVAPKSYVQILKGQDPECTLTKFLLPLSLRTKFQGKALPGVENPPPADVLVSEQQAEQLGEEYELVKKPKPEDFCPPDVPPED